MSNNKIGHGIAIVGIWAAVAVVAYCAPAHVAAVSSEAFLGTLCVAIFL